MLQCTGTECERTGKAALYEANYRVPFVGPRVQLVCDTHADELERMAGARATVPAIENLTFIEL